jgi:hypothetical protein
MKKDFSNPTREELYALHREARRARSQWFGRMIIEGASRLRSRFTRTVSMLGEFRHA